MKQFKEEYFFKEIIKELDSFQEKMKKQFISFFEPDKHKDVFLISEEDYKQQLNLFNYFYKNEEFEKIFQQAFNEWLKLLEENKKELFEWFIRLNTHFAHDLKTYFLLKEKIKILIKNPHLLEEVKKEIVFSSERNNNDSFLYFSKENKRSWGYIVEKDFKEVKKFILNDFSDYGFQMRQCNPFIVVEMTKQEKIMHLVIWLRIKGYLFRIMK